MIEITGASNILRNLDVQLAKIEKGTVDGMLAAALFVEGESNETVPQDKGVLINTSFSSATTKGSVIEGTVGYTALYAPFVHEMPASNNFTKPGTGPKFLQNALFGNISRIISIIKARVKL